MAQHLLQSKGIIIYVVSLQRLILIYTVFYHPWKYRLYQPAMLFFSSNLLSFRLLNVEQKVQNEF